MKFPILIQKIIDMNSSSMDDVFSKKGKIYTFLNPVSYLEALKYIEVFSHFDGVFADGFLLVKAIKMFYGKNVIRRSFDATSVGKELLNYASLNEKSLYIVSSEQLQVENAVKKIKEQFPNIRIVGYRDGFFNDKKDQDEAINTIIQLSPDYLIVGMGIIKQEEFLLRAKLFGYYGIGFTCGGFIRQIAENKIDYYPVWVDKINLRFLYRFYKEPHTRKRYFKAGILFPISFIRERILV